MSNLAELVENYMAGPRQLRTAVAGLSREQITARPIPGKWSVLEVVAHLADFDSVLADRMKRIISHDKPLLMGADEGLYAAKLAYQERDLEEELTLIECTRKQLARVLRTLPADALTRVGVHSERGLKTLEETLVTATNHIRHHLPFVAEKRQAMGLATGVGK